jgi:hypothetical protein
VGIPTVRLTQDDYDDVLVANLIALYLWHKRKSSFSSEQRKDIVDNFRAALVSGNPPVEIAFALAARHGWRKDDVKAELFQAIWRREIRIDLFRGFHFNEPMRAEERDVLDVYGHWFRRH